MNLPTPQTAGSGWGVTPIPTRPFSTPPPRTSFPSSSGSLLRPDHFVHSRHDSGHILVGELILDKGKVGHDFVVVVEHDRHIRIFANFIILRTSRAVHCNHDMLQILGRSLQFPHQIPPRLPFSTTLFQTTLPTPHVPL